MQRKQYRPDDTIYCERCEVPLQYDKAAKTWVAQWQEADVPEIKKCRIKTPFGEEQRYDHIPKGNVSRLLRAAKKMQRKF